MALSGDGRRLAIGTSEGDVLIVDAQTQRTLRTIHAHSHRVEAQFLHDGTLMTSSRDERVSLWDTKTGRLTKSLPECDVLAASRDGKRIALKGPGAAFQVFEATSGRQLAVPATPASNPDDFINSLVLSPDGRQAAWGSWLGDVTVWDVGRGTVVWSERFSAQSPMDRSGEHGDPGGQGIRATLSFSPDGQRLALGGDGGLLIMYDAVTGQRLSSDSRTGDSYVGSIYALSFLPNGRSLVAGYSLGLVRRVSVPEGKEEFSVESGVGPILDLAASPDGKRIYSLHHGGFLGINDAGTGAGMIDGMKRTILSAAYSPDGEQLATGGTDGVIQFFSLPSGKPLRTLKANATGVAGLQFSPNGKMLASRGRDDRLRVWSSTSGAQLWEASVVDSFHGNLAFTPDGETLLAGDGRFIAAWDTRSGAKLRTVSEQPESFNGLAVSPDGKYVAVGGDDGRIHLWDIRSGVRVFALPEQPRYTTNAEDVAFTPDGRELVFRDTAENSLFRYSVPDGRLLEKRLILYSNRMFLLPDGKKAIVSSGGDAQGGWGITASVSDSDGRSTAIFQDLAGVGAIVTVSPDGKFFATAGDDGILRIWSIP